MHKLCVGFGFDSVSRYVECGFGSGSCEMLNVGLIFVQSHVIC